MPGPVVGAGEPGSGGRSPCHVDGGGQQLAFQPASARKLPLDLRADARAGVLSAVPESDPSPSPEMHAKPSAYSLAAGTSPQRTVIGYPEKNGEIQSASPPSAVTPPSRELDSCSDTAAPAGWSSAAGTPGDQLPPPPLAAAAASPVEPSTMLAVVATGLQVVRGHLESRGLAIEAAFCPISLHTYAWPTQQWDVNHR